jgi:hypothetical protein
MKLCSSVVMVTALQDTTNTYKWKSIKPTNFLNMRHGIFGNVIITTLYKLKLSLSSPRITSLV